MIGRRADGMTGRAQVLFFIFYLLPVKHDQTGRKTAN